MVKGWAAELTFWLFVATLASLCSGAVVLLFRL